MQNNHKLSYFLLYIFKMRFVKCLLYWKLKINKLFFNLLNIKMLKNNIISDKFKILNGEIDILKKKYLQEEPFPHIVLKNFFKEEFLDKILEEFPDLNKKKKFWKIL